MLWDFELHMSDIGKYAALFPGQGCQYLGMCQEFIKRSPAAKKIFNEANEILGFDLHPLFNGKIEELTLSINAQPAVVTASYILFCCFLDQYEISPYCAVGHSLGEITALIAAGALSFSDGLLYAHERGKLMHLAVQENVGRAGVVVDLDLAVLNELIVTLPTSDTVSISGYNSNKQFVVAGTKTALSSLADLVEGQGGHLIPFRMMPMKVDAPYHTPLMSFLIPQFEPLLAKMEFKKPKFKIWSTVTGKIIHSKNEIPQLLLNQLVSPVYWNQAVEQIKACGTNLFFDIGPGRIMRDLMREKTDGSECFAFDFELDREIIFEKDGMYKDTNINIDDEMSYVT